MIIKSLEIKEIKLLSFDFKNRKVDLEINFSNDSPIRKTYDLKFVKEIPDMIFRDIKAEKKPQIDFSSDILDTISSVNIKNDEEPIKECLFKFLVRIDQKLKNFTHMSDAKQYMKEYNLLSTYQEIIYRK